MKKPALLVIALITTLSFIRPEFCTAQSYYGDPTILVKIFLEDGSTIEETSKRLNLEGTFMEVYPVEGKKIRVKKEDVKAFQVSNELRYLKMKKHLLRVIAYNDEVLLGEYVDDGTNWYYHFIYDRNTHELIEKFLVPGSKYGKPDVPESYEKFVLKYFKEDCIKKLEEKMNWSTRGWIKCGEKELAFP